MEAYKEPSGKALLRSVEILKDFPEQIIILNNTIIICGSIFRPQEKLIHLIDVGQTRGFKLFCETLTGPENVEKFIKDHRDAAIFQMERIFNDANKFIDGCKGLLDTFTSNELKIIRKRESFTEEIVEKIFKRILETSMIMFQTHPETKRIPTIDELPHTFIFHNCLCMILIFIKWIEKGSPQVVKQSHTRNDIIDANFASFALYFDGLLTNDKNLQELYDKAKVLLNTFKGQLGQA